MYGEINGENIKTEFVELENNRYQIIDVDASDAVDREMLIQYINDLKLNEECFYEIKLVGTRRFEINIPEIARYISAENILKMKDETSSAYAFDDLSEETSLRGFFVREMMERIENACDEDKDKLRKAMEIGLDALE